MLYRLSYSPKSTPRTAKSYNRHASRDGLAYGETPIQGNVRFESRMTFG